MTTVINHKLKLKQEFKTVPVCSPVHKDDRQNFLGRSDQGQKTCQEGRRAHELHGICVVPAF
jgi:hypothetical protein